MFSFKGGYGEDFAELLEPAGGLALHGADGAAERLRGVVDGQVVDVAEHDGGPHLRREGPQRCDELDAELLAALGSLPPRMRAAVVLRHVHDLSVDDTAHALGCSVGTVKSQTARGLDKLRAALAVPTLEGEHR